MKKIVILSGAGMSAESGLQTFRDANGLWENYDIEEVATPEAWRKNPDLVTAFYNARRKQIIESQPNEAHFLIAGLEKSFEVSVITQNIDDLHERANSSDILHLHGNIRFSKSSGPNQEKVYYPIEGWELNSESKCPEGYRLRPHVVWFGESVPLLENAAEMVSTADIFLVIGTSLNVYPAAGLIHAVNSTCHCYLIDPNANELNIGRRFTIIAKNAVEGMKEFVELVKKH